MKKISQEKVKKYLRYNRRTGKFTWRISPNFRIRVGAEAGTLNQGYISIKIESGGYLSHRLAWIYVMGKCPRHIDHINGIRTDNRFCNLRLASRFINNQNRHAPNRNNSHNLLGVTRNGNGFMAQIGANRKHYYIGHYKTPQAAHVAYLKAKRQMHPGCTI